MRAYVKGVPVDLDGVRGMTAAEYNALSEDERQGLVVITDANPTGVSGEGSNGIYSTEEVRIGTWIDGDIRKPLYRKVFKVSCPAPKAAWTPIVNLSDLNIEKEIKMDVSLDLGSTDRVTYANFVSPSGGHFLKSYNNQTKSVEIYNLIGVSVEKTISVIIEYTKTTDGAVSG